MGQFIFRELWADRETVSSQVMEKFTGLDARVTTLEGIFSCNSNSNTDLCIEVPDDQNESEEDMGEDPKISLHAISGIRNSPTMQ
ncbi:hypothetical protein M9H77_30053 [Catharanthus roseus]|uniref:Uncharacterized protein n=1 Tax=Catharanthus roseus TaxID=4058 RepID=A0ACB9ZX20_CATRO|nr:hypothetical protein M9H77_30053 [Catharanthus roseus]